MNSIIVKEQLLTFDRPRIMGILNLTPDSFYDGNRFNTVEKVILQVGKMVREGVDIVDVGAASSRPGAELLTASEEINRLKPILNELKSQFPELLISIDTYQRKVAEFAIVKGASIINDISAFEIDPQMLDFLIESNTPYIMMHMQGNPGNMQASPTYKSVTGEILKFFIEKLRILKSRQFENTIIDPGFGFGKSIAHNFELLQNLKVFQMLEKPILVGLSRKSMIYKLLDISAEESLSATSALHLQALLNGARILRVHDVKEAKQIVDLYKMVKPHNERGGFDV